MKPDQYLIVGLGELLWDMLPGGKQMGGAPANFACMSAQLGDCGVIASRVGTDSLGKEAINRLQKANLTTDYIQIDPSHTTGLIHVKIDRAGQPDFVIEENVAWDFLDFTFDWKELSKRADAICFGTLAQRSHSRTTIHAFLQTTRSDALRIFDVNLRQSFYSSQILRESLKLASIVKLNDNELPSAIDALSLKSGSIEESARRLIESYDLEMVCVTRGLQGSLIVTPTDMVEHTGIAAKVVDSVGAGDAFTAALAHHYLRGSSLDQISEAANRLGAWVASQAGATPIIEPQILKQIIAGANSA